MFSDLFQSFLLPYLPRDVRPYLALTMATPPPLNENENFGRSACSTHSALLMHETFGAHEWVTRVTASTIHRRKVLGEVGISAYKSMELSAQPNQILTSKSRLDKLSPLKS